MEYENNHMDPNNEIQFQDCKPQNINDIINLGVDDTCSNSDTEKLEYKTMAETNDNTPGKRNSNNFDEIWSCKRTKSGQQKSRILADIIEEFSVRRNQIRKVIDRTDIIYNNEVIGLLENNFFEKREIEYDGQNKLAEYYHTDKELESNKYFLKYINLINPNRKLSSTSLNEYIEKERSSSELRGYENRAVYKYSPSILVNHHIIKNIHFNTQEWSEKDADLFWAFFSEHGKRFDLISKSFKEYYEETRDKKSIDKSNDKTTKHEKSVKECISFYYKNKRKVLPRKKKKRVGRISDREIKEIVESTWNDTEMETFEQHFKEKGCDWSLYIEVLPNKTEKELNTFYKYYKKNRMRKTESSCASPRLRRGRPKTRKKNTQMIKKTSIGVSPQKLDSANNEIKMKIEILKNWTIDERQVFAIYFPYLNRNWSAMEQYIPTKKAQDFRLYHRYYFRHLSILEQQFETTLQNIKKEKLSCPGSPKHRKEVEEYCDGSGILFSNRKHNLKHS
ncbi:hypothetical protein TCON_0745 [Astathelohania contejeani]|uniref:Myb-like domain-containing protein n=1 Tax=Astathelohania contejeani TaxID=164912 RepID=A0ABQ7I0X7_9MICR|nr:hypothetical protein TCON_0745 [Thelohania contejeani]